MYGVGYGRLGTVRQAVVPSSGMPYNVADVVDQVVRDGLRQEDWLARL